MIPLESWLVFVEKRIFLKILKDPGVKDFLHCSCNTGCKCYGPVARLVPSAQGNLFLVFKKLKIQVISTPQSCLLQAACNAPWCQDCTVWCSEFGSLTSLDARTSGASCDVWEPISLYRAVNRQWLPCGFSACLFRARNFNLFKLLAFDLMTVRKYRKTFSCGACGLLLVEGKCGKFCGSRNVPFEFVHASQRFQFRFALHVWSFFCGGDLPHFTPHNGKFPFFLRLQSSLSRTKFSASSNFESKRKTVIEISMSISRG